MIRERLQSFIATIAVASLGAVGAIFHYHDHLSRSEQIAHTSLRGSILDAVSQIDIAALGGLTERAQNREIIRNPWNDPEYAKTSSVLRAIRERNSLETPVYVLTRVVDLDRPPRYFVACSSSGSGRPTEITPPRQLREQWKRGGFASLYDDEFGTWVTAFVPIFEDSEVLAVIIADQEFSAYRAAALQSAFLVLAIALLLSFGVFVIERRVHESRLEAERQRETRRRWLESEVENARSESTAKSRFLATLSAELRTSLDAARLRSESLLETRLSPEQHSLMQQVRGSTLRMTLTIRDLSTIVDLEQGRFRATNSSFGLYELLDSIEESVRPSAESKGVDLEFTVSGSLPLEVVGDGPKLRQALQKILENALTHTEVGQVRCVVSPLAQDHGTLRMRFDITDSGSPIPQSSLGESGLQSIDSSASATTEGSRQLGVDLAIARFFVRCLGSEIEITSSESGGGRFIFEPSFEVPTDWVDPALPQLGTGSAEELPHGIRVLVAEDDAASRRFALNFLQRAKVHHVAVEDGLEAVDAYRRDPFDVVLMDCLMPELDGLEATRRIRRIEVERELDRSVIIAVTAHSLDGDQKRMLDAGMDAVLKKPYRPEDLEAMIWLQWTQRQSVQGLDRPGDSEDVPVEEFVLSSS